MSARINYPAAELVEGGRTYEQAGCTVLGDDYDLATAGAVALTAIGCGPTLRWAVVDVAAGNVVLAEATSPADLLPWLTEYAAAIETAEWAADDENPFRPGDRVVPAGHRGGLVGTVVGVDGPHTIVEWDDEDGPQEDEVPACELVRLDAEAAGR